MPELVSTYRGTVYPWQCDQMGHMNVMWYTAKFDEASWQMLSQLGLTASRLRKARTAMAAVEQRIEQKREHHAGDLVTIRSAALEVKEKSIRMTHEMTNDEIGEVVATTVIVGVYLQGLVRKARLLPQDVRERATLMIAGELIRVNSPPPDMLSVAAELRMPIQWKWQKDNNVKSIRLLDGPNIRIRQEWSHGIAVRLETVEAAPHSLPEPNCELRD